ncbi:hypothetical protein Taro_015452 [Colocasia esculenta]|uniref:Uncharacterized protein n=1 Tax=Colocasia esculenta TaxID=4460 RepID=A0A843UBH7_COLES|nr:hypothetical protein [Colocasia esculenta]
MDLRPFDDAGSSSWSISGHHLRHRLCRRRPPSPNHQERQGGRKLEEEEREKEEEGPLPPGVPGDRRSKAGKVVGSGEKGRAFWTPPTSFKPPTPHHLRPLWLRPPSVMATAASEKPKNH